METFILVLILRGGIPLDYGTYPSYEKCAAAARVELARTVGDPHKEFRCEKRVK